MTTDPRQYFTFADNDKGFQLDSGRSLASVTLAYETWGRLNENRSNAILILHAFSGDSHVASHILANDQAGGVGWWEAMVGPGKGVDTDKYFVICANILGSCCGSTGPGSLNPETGLSYGLDFPMVTIADIVRAQKVLIDHLGISRLYAVIGGSVGGMQVLQWCVSYPDMVQAAIPLATTMRHSALCIAVKFLVISFTSDWLYPTYQSKELVRALKRNGCDVSFCEVQADCGHDAFLLPDQRLTSLVSGFLDGVKSR